MSDDIVQRLRDACPATQDFTHTAQGALMDEAADAIEALTAERDRLREALRDGRRLLAIAQDDRVRLLIQLEQCEKRHE